MLDTVTLTKVVTKTVTKHRVDTLVQTKVDSARMKALQVIIAKQDKLIEILEKESAQWKAKAKNRSRNQFISFGFNLLLILGIGYILGKKIKKP
jgi:hypothetical protein